LLFDILQIIVSIPKYTVGGNKPGNYQNISDSYGHLGAVVSDEVYPEDLDMEDILHGMDTLFVYDTASGMDSSVNSLRSIQ